MRPTEVPVVSLFRGCWPASPLCLQRGESSCVRCPSSEERVRGRGGGGRREGKKGPGPAERRVRRLDVAPSMKKEVVPAFRSLASAQRRKGRDVSNGVIKRKVRELLRSAEEERERPAEKGLNRFPFLVPRSAKLQASTLFPCPSTLTCSLPLSLVSRQIQASVVLAWVELRVR